MADVFRQEYTKLTQDKWETMKDIKVRAQELWDQIDSLTCYEPENVREISLAKNKLEEAVMWAVKGITG